MGLVGGRPLKPDPSFARQPDRVVVKLKPDSTRALEPAAAGKESLSELVPGLPAQWANLRPRPYLPAAIAAGRSLEAAATSADTERWRSYVAVDCPSADAAEDLADAMRRSDAVEHAYRESRPAPPPAVQPGDDPLAASQGYLDEAPLGINARFAWDEIGLDGEGVRLVDVEYGWTLNHEDLRAPTIPLHSGVINRFRFHGTAVLGQIVARDNQHGCVGIAPNATVTVVSQERSPDIYNPTEAILDASRLLRRGDVLLLEMQSEHPRVPYVPIEIDQAVFAAIKSVTDRGIIVVEPAGNAKEFGVSGTDLALVEDGAGRKVFDPNGPDARDSGAIIVGAASAGSSHRRLEFSNFGGRVNCFAWGENVQTCGDAGDEFSTTGYTASFGGTSAAAPIIAGAAVLLQNSRLKAGLPVYTPKQMRDLLSATGHNTHSGDPEGDQIGVMPNLRAILEHERAVVTPAPAPGVTDPVTTADAPLMPRPVWLSYLALALLTIGNAVLPGLKPAPPPGVETPKVAAVDFGSSGSIEISGRDAGAARAVVFVRNDESQPATVKLVAVLSGHNGALINETVATGTVDAQSIVPITVRFPLSTTYGGRWDSRLPARGSLRMEAVVPGATKAVRFRDASVPQVQPALAELMITGVAFVVSAALLVLGFSLTAAVLPPESAPAWTPRSWSSNLAIGGALLTALLAMTALPAQTHLMARGSYTALSPFFAVLVALAPVAYDLWKVPGSVTPQSGLRLFAFSAAVTLWATLGQLGTSAVLFLELGAAGAISWTAALAAAVVVTGVALALVVYAFRAVSSYTAPAVAGRLETFGARQAVRARPWTLL